MKTLADKYSSKLAKSSTIFKHEKFGFVRGWGTNEKLGNSVIEDKNFKPKLRYYYI